MTAAAEILLSAAAGQTVQLPPELARKLLSAANDDEVAACLGLRLSQRIRMRDAALVEASRELAMYGATTWQKAQTLAKAIQRFERALLPALQAGQDLPLTPHESALWRAYPSAATLRRAQPWQPRPKLPDAMRQAAVHEAGHIVLMQWVGLLPPEATIAAIGDAPMLPELLSQIPADETIGSVSGDGAYDTQACHKAIAQRQASAVIPPRRSAKLWKVKHIGDPSQSEADLALVKLLLPHADSSRECWLTFRLSKLLPSASSRSAPRRRSYAR